MRGLTSRRVAPYPPDWWQYQNLQGHGARDNEDEYQALPRRGFETLADLEAFWSVHRERLIGDYGTDTVKGWWAFRTWG